MPERFNNDFIGNRQLVRRDCNLFIAFVFRIGANFSDWQFALYFRQTAKLFAAGLEVDIFIFDRVAHYYSFVLNSGSRLEELKIFQTASSDFTKNPSFN